MVLQFHEYLLQTLAHEQRHFIVERRERLVQKQHFWFGHQRAQDRDRLLLASGQRVRIGIEIEGNVKVGEQLFDATVTLLLRGRPAP